MSGEFQQKFEFPGGQVDGLPLDGHLPFLRIDGQVARPDHLLRRRGVFPPHRFHPSQECFYACQKLADVEGFRKIVVRPHLQSQDPVHIRGPGSKHQYGGVVRSRSYMTTYLQPVHPRKDEIEDDDVVRLRESRLKPGFPVVNDGHRISLIP